MENNVGIIMGVVIYCICGSLSLTDIQFLSFITKTNMSEGELMRKPKEEPEEDQNAG